MQISHPPCIQWCSVCGLGRPLMYGVVARKSLAHQNRMYRCTYVIVTFFCLHAPSAQFGVYIQQWLSVAINNCLAHRLKSRELCFGIVTNTHFWFEVKQKLYTTTISFCRLSDSQTQWQLLHRYSWWSFSFFGMAWLATMLLWMCLRTLLTDGASGGFCCVCSVVRFVTHTFHTSWRQNIYSTELISENDFNWLNNLSLKKWLF